MFLVTKNSKEMYVKYQKHYTLVGTEPRILRSRGDCEDHCAIRLKAKTYSSNQIQLEKSFFFISTGIMTHAFVSD
jgi:hypothetical protein